MENENNIDSLVADLKPVKPLHGPLMRSLYWLAPQFVISLIVINLVKPMSVNFYEGALYYSQVLMVFVSLIAGAYLGFSNVIPGVLSEKKKKLAIIPLFILLALLIINFFLPVIASPQDIHRSYCIYELSFLMVVGFAHNYFMLKKGFIAFKNSTIIISLLTSAMIPLSLMYISCSFETKHVLLAHYLPIILISGVIFLIYKVYKK